MIEIRPARVPEDIERVRNLFREYAASLDVDLAFQGFEAELDGLPGKYEPPQGRLLLAWRAEEPVGCIALRALAGSSCEMKRLYVRPDARGAQLGVRLIERICREASEAGYSRICLDTLPSMASAIRLYEALGFKSIEPYTRNPVPGALFLALEL